MNGAESLVRTLVAGGVEVCFTNPGTSEMHFVAALDRVEGMRCVLGLFEGVVTGAADGYGRMADKPAATLLHLGPGLGNGLANLHNASRAQVPIINIVGEHATYHKRYDAPLNADIPAIAGQYSRWLRTSMSAAEVASDGAAAIAASRMTPGRIATLILPADTAWTEGTGIAPVPPIPAPLLPDPAAIDRAAAALSQKLPSAIVLGGRALRAEALAIAGRIAAATGARLLAAYSMARLQRGAGRVAVERVPYPIDQALALLAPLRHMLLIGSAEPIAFFAYPGKPSRVVPESCEVHKLCEPETDLVATLAALADAVGAKADPKREPLARPAMPKGAITLPGLADAVAATLPENAIVVDESITSGRGLLPATKTAPPHDWLVNTGGSIGIGLPLAVGAAVACPDRPVLCLESDGSGMYTLQGLWTMAREGLNVTVVIFANRVYNILKGELANVGAGNPGRRALDMLEIGRPDLDWLSLARGMGVPATRADRLEDLAAALQRGYASRGPSLIEVPL
jgi:acetolactate synthase I/II/III large subunit